MRPVLCMRAEIHYAHSARARTFVPGCPPRFAAASFRHAPRVFYALAYIGREVPAMGSYLGLKLETVSRIFSRLQSEGLIRVKQKFIRILDRPRLERVMGRNQD